MLRPVADLSWFGDPGQMVAMDEDQALEHVRERLIEQFPGVCPEAIRITVQDIHIRFDGRVRIYVPILVEREAKIRLAELSGQADRERAET
jgi:GTPase Era involved in 16S rRNA processing